MTCENPPAIWEQCSDVCWKYVCPMYAVYAVVYKEELSTGIKFRYVVKCMLTYRIDGKVPEGLARDLDSAKRIVESICAGTNTCDKK